MTAYCTVGRLARRFGLSRSTLLYYHRCGLLVPSRRSEAGYRMYTPGDVERLERILLFRSMGVPLAAVGPLLAESSGSVAQVLEQRLRRINGEITTLRRQQRLIMELLGEGRLAQVSRSLDKAGWVAVLRAAGMSDTDMDRWHREFERLAPSAHQDFLESLGLGAEEIGRIRTAAAAA